MSVCDGPGAGEMDALHEIATRRAGGNLQTHPPEALAERVMTMQWGYTPLDRATTCGKLMADSGDIPRRQYPKA